MKRSYDGSPIKISSVDTPATTTLRNGFMLLGVSLYPGANLIGSDEGPQKGSPMPSTTTVRSDAQRGEGPRNDASTSSTSSNSSQSHGISCVDVFDPLSPDCICVVLGGSSSGACHLWDVRTGDNKRTNAGNASAAKKLPLATLIGHTHGVNDVKFSPRFKSFTWTHFVNGFSGGGFYAVSGSDDKTIRLWDLDFLKGVIFPSTIAGSESAVFGSKNTNEASDSLYSPPCLATFSGHSSYVFSLAISPSATLLASGAFDETCKLWDIRSQSCVKTLPAHSDPVTGIVFSTCGRFVITSGYDGLVRVWGVGRGECVWTGYARGNPRVWGIGISPSGGYLGGVYGDGACRLWDIGDVVGVDNGGGNGSNSGGSGEDGGVEPSQIQDLSFSLEQAQGSDQSQGRNGSKSQDIKAGRCVKTYSGHKGENFCSFIGFLWGNAGVTPEIVTGSEEGGVFVYGVNSREVTARLDTADEGTEDRLAREREGKADGHFRVSSSTGKSGPTIAVATAEYRKGARAQIVVSAASGLTRSGEESCDWKMKSGGGDGVRVWVRNFRS